MAEKEKFPIDLRDFRAKTIARIIDKKREDQLREVKDYESKRAEANAFRTKWKEQVKDKRNKEVVEAVDDDLIRAAIPDIDNNNSNTAFLEKKLQNEQNLMELISDLHPVEDLENFDRKRDSGVFTVSMPDAYSSSSKAAFEFNTGGIIPSSIKFLQKVGAFELQVRDKLNDVVEEENGSAAHISNKLQISSLMNDLLNIHSMKNEDMLKFQRPPSGLMLQAIQEAQNSSWLKPFRVERSSSFVSHPYVNGVLRSKSIDPADDPNNSPASPAKQKPKNGKKQQHPLYSSLVENVFLIGPDRASIMSYVESLKSGSNPSESFSPRSLGIGGSESVIPSVLYQSDNDYPPEMMTMLPAYCFPR